MRMNEVQNPNELVINGWCLLAHTLFLQQFENLIAEVEKMRQKNPLQYKEKNARPCKKTYNIY
jgi:hypothetical protein